MSVMLLIWALLFFCSIGSMAWLGKLKLKFLSCCVISIYRCVCLVLLLVCWLCVLILIWVIGWLFFWS